MTERKIMQAVEPFATTTSEKIPLMVARGDLFFDDDEVVRRNPQGFANVEVRRSVGSKNRAREAVSSTSSGALETASAEPGGKRRIGRPPLTTRETKITEPSEV